MTVLWKIGTFIHYLFGSLANPRKALEEISGSVSSGPHVLEVPVIPDKEKSYKENSYFITLGILGDGFQYKSRKSFSQSGQFMKIQSQLQHILISSISDYPEGIKALEEGHLPFTSL